jgi:hypothetical protein
MNRSFLRHSHRDRHELRLTFAELALVYKSLQAARTLVLHPDAELLEDTMHVVDQVLSSAVAPRPS